MYGGGAKKVKTSEVGAMMEEVAKKPVILTKTLGQWCLKRERRGGMKECYATVEELASSC